MPPKRGKKRKATSHSAGETNGHAALTPPDIATWPGWVEMESEPAFFNSMLKEMGVEGVKIQEIYSMDDDMVAILDRPIHALIFLFRYSDVDDITQDSNAKCPKHVWFANQVPDFACASVALLNIVNNIPGLRMGRELCEFKKFTQSMNPLKRGDAIDKFDFLRRIHNSFASENDLLVADEHLKRKAEKARKRQAIEKAQETRRANKAGEAALNGKSTNGATSTSSRKSARTQKPVEKETQKANTSKARAPKKSANEAEETDPDGGDYPTPDSKDTPEETKPAARGKASIKPSALHSRESSPLSETPSDLDFDAPAKGKGKGKTSTKAAAEPTRRSSRQPKPRKDIYADKPAAEKDEDDEEGFHFIAFIPIQGHVWKLDGLNHLPEDVGEFDAENGGDWMNVAQPYVMERMLNCEETEINFNLMAVVHDPLIDHRTKLLQTAKEIRMIQARLDAFTPDWRELIDDESERDVTSSMDASLDISEADIEGVTISKETAEKLKQDDDLDKLLELRKEIVGKQPQLRGDIRAAIAGAKVDVERARHRKHDYPTFLKAWLGALADNGVLENVIEGHQSSGK